MKMFKIIAVSAILVAGASSAFASPFNVMGGLDSLDAISDATSASVLSVNAGEARFLAFDNDVDALRQRVQNNQYLARSVADQGYTIDQIVGIDGDGASLTLYAL